MKPHPPQLASDAMNIIKNLNAPFTLQFTTYKHYTLIPRPSPAPVFDRLQNAKTEGLGMRLIAFIQTVLYFFLKFTSSTNTQTGVCYVKTKRG